MKLKSGVIINEFDGEFIAIAAGESAKSFNGMLKLNSTAVYICKLLQSDTDIHDLTDRLCEKYDVDREKAIQNIQSVLNTLDQVGLLDK